jgi:hypothetical protein
MAIGMSKDMELEAIEASQASAAATWIEEANSRKMIQRMVGRV